MELTVYLAGQVHDDWRKDFAQKASDRGLKCNFVGPQPGHDLSDGIGEAILGEAPSPRWKDELASQVNNLRTRVHMQKADVVVAYYGEKYRQWNVAMDSGLALAQDKPLILVRDEGLHHALKELSQRAQMTVETFDQAIEALTYISIES